MRGRWWVCGVWAVLLLLARPAQACSPVEGYVRPSNFELAQIAEAIVIATPVAERAPKGPDEFPGRGAVVFRVSEALKGDASGDVEVAGLRLGRTRPSAADDIRYSHPEGHAGPCNRMTFAPGGVYLLFLARVDGRYVTLGYPFSRVSEDYAGPDSLWARTVRAYLEIQRADPPMAQFDRLEALRASLRAGKAPGDAVRATDIDEHLGSISPWKPTAFLLDAWDREAERRPPRYPPRKGDFDAEQSDAEAMTEAMMKNLVGDRPRPPKPRYTAAQQRILRALIEGEHPDAVAVFAPFMRAGAPADELAFALRFLTANGRQREAYDLVEARAEAAVAAAGPGQVEPLLWAVAEAMGEDTYGEDPQRWRSDARAAEWWPGLALKLTTAAQSRGADAPFSRTLKALVQADYRAKPELTLAVSGDDNAITDWAAKELTRPEVLAGPRAEGWADPLLLPLKIHVRWLGADPDNEPPLVAVACAGSAERQMLFREWGRSDGDSILAMFRLSQTPGMTDADRAVLAEAMIAWDKRYKAERGESWITASKAAQKIARRETPTLKDIDPIRPPVCPGR
jgi:hypothetical protein